MRIEPRTAALALTLCGLLGTASAHAQEAPREAAEEARPATDSGEAADPAADKSDDAAASREIFIPTEEISEDFAVSFPVDI